jgi:hypothetical protein
MRNISEAYTSMYEERKMKKEKRLAREAEEAYQAKLSERKDKRIQTATTNKENKMNKRQNTQFGGKSPRNMQEEVISYLMDEGFANNEVSAEVIASHMSEEWMQEALQPLPKDKMDRKQFKLDDTSRFERSRGNYDKSDKMLLRAQNIRNASYQAGPWKGSGADARKRAGFGIGTHKQMKDLANKPKSL